MRRGRPMPACDHFIVISGCARRTKQRSFLFHGHRGDRDGQALERERNAGCEANEAASLETAERRTKIAEATWNAGQQSLGRCRPLAARQTNNGAKNTDVVS